MCLGEIAQVQEIVAPDSVKVRSGERMSTVSTILLDEPVVAGTWVVAHCGFALAVLTESDAREALELRGALGQAPY